ncbi:MAG: sugar MFS transporter [Pyrinomonadaceae bacterium]
MTKDGSPESGAHARAWERCAPRARDYAGRLAGACGSLTFALLLIAFLDEVVDGARQASWAIVRADLKLSYAQVGALLTLPMLFGNLVEPAINLMGDTRRRRALLVGGGLCFSVACALTALSRGFWSLLFAFLVFNPSSGTFVNLSQATLMDNEPARREQNMARWVLAGSLGVVAGALAMGATVAAGAGWRACFAAISVVTLLALLRARRLRLDVHERDEENGARELRRDERANGQVRRGDERFGDQELCGDEEQSAEAGFAESARAALGALRRAEVWRWLVLLEAASVMLDAFHGYLALYFVDVVGAGTSRAGLAVAVWAGCGLAGESALVPVLERVRGLTYLRRSVSVMLFLLPAFLFAPGTAAKLLLVGAVSVCASGWYAILKARLYAALPGRSGAALALCNVAGLVGSLAPLALGLFAERFGLGAAMWLVALFPVLILSALPRETKPRAPC